MKVKNLRVGVVTINELDKVVFVREAPFLKKIIRLALDDDNDQFRCVFTNEQIFIKKRDLLPLAFFLDVEEAKKRMRIKELRELYAKKEELIKSKMIERPKMPVGFAIK